MATSSLSARIRANLASVAEWRAQAMQANEFAAFRSIKRLQAQRFAATYRDFSDSASSRAAVRFFLDELYGEHDFASRDDQFGRIAGALERLFPPSVTQLAVDLTEVHALTERLDHAVAHHWLQLPSETPVAARYVTAWRSGCDRAERLQQLQLVLHIGRELQRLTRNRSLRMGLRLMRKPAHAAGLDALQHFLETGFDAFLSLQNPDALLSAIAKRERVWVDLLFDGAHADASRQLSLELGLAPRQAC